MTQLKNAFFLFGFVLFFSFSSEAQVDIYQSDAYSVEEMCAREAEQNAEFDYTEAYDSCLANNRERPMYQSDSAVDGSAENTEYVATEESNEPEQESYYEPPQNHDEQYHPEVTYE